MSGCEPILQVEHLAVSFLKGDGMVTPVSNVSFSVSPGETVCLVGPSGCGKSVTSQAVMGLLPRGSLVSGGRILWDGADYTRADRETFRAVRGRTASMLFQDPVAALDPVRTIGWQVEEVLRITASVSRGERKKRALTLLEEVGLPAPERQYRSYPHQLSGGMCQRASIAIALAAEPRLLLADEPTTALDPTIQAQILALLRRERERRDMALLLITHDMGVVACMADRVAVMADGVTVEQASVHDLFATPRHAVTRALLNAAGAGSTSSAEEGEMPHA